MLESFGKSLSDYKQFVHSNHSFLRFKNDALLLKGRFVSFKLHLFQISGFSIQQLSPNNSRNLYGFCFKHICSLVSSNSDKGKILYLFGVQLS